jgi:hypothetical protein
MLFVAFMVSASRFTLMENEFERLDPRTLLDTYMQESKEFSVALKAGASWESLQQRRVRIRLISMFINKKYDELNNERRRNKPPHGD